MIGKEEVGQQKQIEQWDYVTLKSILRLIEALQTLKEANRVLTGTAVMQVGCSTLASPLVPFLILVEVSIIVVGVE